MKKQLHGTKGEFEILLETNEKINYKVEFKNKNNKPKNLLFNVEGKDKKYSNLEDLNEQLKGVIQENTKITIQWQWDYENEKNALTNIQDTQDGIKLKEYNFTILAIGE